MIQIKGTYRMVQKSELVNCSDVLLKNPPSTQTRALSHQGPPPQHLHLVSRCLTPLYNLKLYCFIDRKSCSDQDGAHSSVLIGNISVSHFWCSLTKLQKIEVEECPVS